MAGRERTGGDGHGRQGDPQQAGRDQPFPSEAHQLVVAHPGQRRPDPHKHKHQQECLEEEPEDREHPRDRRRVPKSGPCQPPRNRVTVMRRDVEDVDVLGEEEHGEAEPGVLGVVAAHQLVLGLDEIEGSPVGLGDAGDEEDNERRQQHHVPHPERSRGEVAPGLRVDDPGEGRGTGKHDDRAPVPDPSPPRMRSSERLARTAPSNGYLEPEDQPASTTA